MCSEHEGYRAVWQGKWKLIAAHGGPWELYDLEADRTELHDIAEEHAGKRNELIARYAEWAKRCGVRPWPIKKP